MAGVGCKRALGGGLLREYCPGQLNPTDTLSRRSDYAIVNEEEDSVTGPLPKVQSSATEATMHSVKAGDRVLESQVEAGTKDHKLLMSCLAAI
ncbi:uncharacterized protein PADG_11883 [Paracoccidioides brasiliensis Pb18]|uniref:Uncharacterized protein n=1 Tax=Paracoccidioides brasiliensis (strain Pb18) TaxID=502780 RepID=A0A0A0HV48_PARBD|nr:uncharacterized protein PADG_11883 [Paracoccidioides brasiliensis Pb18]KGM91911.1 hypothetical protein PADG_11883 [Paracoccidioides brasiliensis Pb18]